MTDGVGERGSVQRLGLSWQVTWDSVRQEPLYPREAEAWLRLRDLEQSAAAERLAPEEVERLHADLAEAAGIAQAASHD